MGRKTHSAVPSNVCVVFNTFFMALDEDGRQRFETASNMQPTNSRGKKKRKNKDLSFVFG